MEIQEAIKHVMDGKGLLFVGSGFSAGAINLRNERFLSGPSLAEYFVKLSGLTIPTDLEDAAELFVDKFGTDALIKELQELFTAKTVCNYHRGIASLPWKRVYTTNYDNVFEFSSQLEGLRVTSVTSGTNIYQIPKDHLTCVHLNGYVQTLNREKIQTELKLTDTSYLTNSIAESKWCILFRQDIKMASAVIFIGYSLYDLDIRRILAEVGEAKEKTFFCVGPNPEEKLLRRAKRFGNVLKLSAEEFFSIVEETAKIYTPQGIDESNFLSIREYKMPSGPSYITDKSFVELLLWGRRKEELIAESLRTDTYYYLERTKIEEAIQKIENGVNILVVCSDLGNGKSMFLEGLGIRAIDRGFRVFHPFDHNEGTKQELDFITRLNGKVMVMIEEYQNWLDEIRLFCTNAGDQAVLVLTARNAIHDIMFDELTTIIGDRELFELNIDNLSDTDIDWIVNALDHYGLWGRHAGLRRSQKINYMESPDIGARLKDVVGRIRSKGSHYEILLSIFILTLLNHPVTIDVLIDIWGADKIGSPQFRTDPVIKELVSFDYSTVRLRSSIVADYLLHSFADASTLVSVLIKMVQRVEKGSEVNPRYYSLFKNLMRFGCVQTLLPKQGKRNAVIRYYEAIKTLDKCRQNSLFWLQYAIASLVIEELPRAKRYFDTAYALAEKRGLDTFQIDNHFARFLMEQAVKEDLDVSSATKNYRQAWQIIDRQMKDERRHYPYRVAINFYNFIIKYGSKMELSQIEDLASKANKILNRINELSEYRRQNRYVIKCQKAMNDVINICSELIAEKSNSSAIKKH